MQAFVRSRVRLFVWGMAIVRYGVTNAAPVTATASLSLLHARMMNIVLHGAPHTPGPRREAQGEAFAGLMCVAYICDGGVWTAGILISELRAPTTPDPHANPQHTLGQLPRTSRRVGRGKIAD